MLTRPKRTWLNTTADILNSLKEGSDSGSMIFCMAAFVSVLLLQKELEEDLVNASPATRYSIFGVLCLCVVGFALHAHRKADRERVEKIKEAEKSEKLIRRIEELELKVNLLENTTQSKKFGVVREDDNTSLLPTINSSLTTPLLRN